MAIELDTLEQRVIGVLIEKQLTVPDSYPLTLNTLVTACNQKSNRDPVMAVEDLDAHQIFTTVIQITYRAHSAA